jgi:hypothetical protein
MEALLQHLELNYAGRIRREPFCAGELMAAVGAPDVPEMASALLAFEGVRVVAVFAEAFQLIAFKLS